MAGLNSSVSFTLTVTHALAGKQVIFVKHAQGGQPIGRWHKAWKPAAGNQPQASGDLYDRLMKSVKKSLGNNKPDSITFVWRQGERDAREGHGAACANSSQGVVDQLEADLKFKPIHVAVGRLSDFENKAYQDWNLVGKTQVAVGTSGTPNSSFRVGMKQVTRSVSEGRRLLEGFLAYASGYFGCFATLILDADAPLSSQHAAWVNTDDLNGPKNDLHYTKKAAAGGLCQASRFQREQIDQAAPAA